MLTEKDYCDYDTCVALRELGYDAPQRLLVDYFGVYDEPQYDERIHLYEAQKWLREEKCIDIQIMISDYNLRWYYVEIYGNGFYKTLKNGYAIKNFITYEEALLEGIKEAVKILKEEE